MSQLFADTSTIPLVQASVQYGEAIAFSVQLQQVAARPYWRVRPLLVMLAAFDSTSFVSGGSQQSAVSPNAPLDVDFCGLNRPDLAGAWPMLDSGNAAGARSQPDALMGPDAWQSGAALASQVLNQSFSAFLTPALTAEMLYLLTNSAFTSGGAMQADLLSPSVPAAALGRALAVPDGSGGFAVPMRNTFMFTDGSGHLTTLAGRALLFCSITVVEPYVPLAAFGAYPAYSDAAAALGDTVVLNGASPAPLAVPGYVLDPWHGDALTYFIPSVPVSTSGVVCGDSSILQAYAPTGITVQFQPYTTATCANLLARGSPAGRRLMSTQSSLFKPPARSPKTAPTAGVLIEPAALPQTRGVVVPSQAQHAPVTARNPVASPPPPPASGPALKRAPRAVTVSAAVIGAVGAVAATVVLAQVAYMQRKAQRPVVKTPPHGQFGGKLKL